MRKFLIITLLLLCIRQATEAQSVAINNQGVPGDPSAMLDIKSTEKGLLIPRMDAGRRASIVNPAEGLLVYDTDSKTIWYYTYASPQGWREISNTLLGATPTGPAFGDLYGTYPSPNVGKIQNLDVAFGVPFDKQSLKWDMLNNRWQAQNDSLFLPYNVTFGSSSKLFGITNSNTTPGSAAIYGKSSNTGSGISPSVTAGVWGDNNNGAGVIGTSNNGVGTYGYSVNNDGAYGFTAATNHAGVYGGRVNNGPAIMGEIFAAGIGIYGKSNGTSGKAALFENTNAANADTVARFINIGLGANTSLLNSNTNNTGVLFTADHYGKGAGMRLFMHNSQNNEIGLAVNQFGNGTGLYVGSEKSKAAEFYTNALNTDTTVSIRQDGSGKGLQLNLTNTSNSSNAITVLAKGTGNAGYFEIDNTGNSLAAVYAQTNGSGQAINATNLNPSSLEPSIKGISFGSTGISGYGNLAGVYGFSTGASAGTGVWGQTFLNDNTGIGVKGISYSTNSSTGAVTGINNSSGVGVHGHSTSGTGGSFYSLGTDEYSLIADAGFSSSLSHAALFRNSNITSTREVVEIQNFGMGNELYIQSLRTAKSFPVVTIVNYGTGNFLSFRDAFSSVKFAVEKSGDVTTQGSISADGNISTDGTITVKTNKGIIRNSSATQMRMQELTVSIPSGNLPHFDEFNSSVVVSVSFSPAFSTTPSVYKGNFIVAGVLKYLSISINNVTASGCDIVIENTTSRDLSWGASSLKIMAIGAE